MGEHKRRKEELKAEGKLLGTGWCTPELVAPPGTHMRPNNAHIYRNIHHDPLKGHTGEVHSVAYSPDGQHTISGSYDRTIRIWDAETGDLVGDPLKGHTGAVHSVAYSPDGQHIISGSYDSTIRIWDAKTGSPGGDPLKGHTGWVHSVAYSPDGHHIISGSYDRTIRIWDAETRAPVGDPLKGHTDCVHSVAYSPDGQHIISGSYDRTIRIWNAKTGSLGGGPLQRLYNDLVRSVAYHSLAPTRVSPPTTVPAPMPTKVPTPKSFQSPFFMTRVLDSGPLDSPSAHRRLNANVDELRTLPPLSISAQQSKSKRDTTPTTIANRKPLLSSPSSGYRKRIKEAPSDDDFDDVAWCS